MRCGGDWIQTFADEFTITGIFLTCGFEVACPVFPRDVHGMVLIKRFICFFTLLAITFTSSRAFSAGNDLSDVKAQVTKQHDEAIKRLQDWIGQVSIAAENRGYPEGADYMIKLLKDAGFQRAERVETDGKPGVFATLDAGAPKTVGLYFMYDVKQFDPKEWSSPPTEAAIVDRPGLGKIMIGRGAVNQKGPGSNLPRSAACDEGRRAQDAGQLRFRCGRRRRNWLAAFRPGRAQAGSRAGALEVRGNFHADGEPGPQRHGHGHVSARRA